MKIIILPLLVGLITFTAFGQLTVPPMPIKERTLSNGLRIVTLQDNSNPTVAIRVWYNVGGKNDPPGRSGFAHMFEHMMFKSTKNMPNEKMDRLTEDVGGYNNASTWPDFTNYFEVVPSNHLERILWAEADRMVNLNVDDANFNSERDVVKEEYRQGVLANPYGRLFQLTDSLSYQKHPYRRGVIGNLEELDAATPKDAEKFYQAFYRPDNAVLIVVGDFDEKNLTTWVDKYFSPIAKPSSSIDRVTDTEPDWTKERRYKEYGPIVPFPATAITFLAPSSRHVDVPALQIAEVILSGGESSRLYVELVRNQKISQQASLRTDIRVDRGLLTFLAIASDTGTSEMLEKSILAEIKKMQDTAVLPRELEKAKNQLISSIIRQRETNDGRAGLIENSLAYLGDPRGVNTIISKLQAVTAADIQRVMRTYMKEDSQVVIYYNQEPKTESNKND